MLTQRILVNRCVRLRPETDHLLTLANLEPLLLAAVKTSPRDWPRR